MNVTESALAKEITDLRNKKHVCDVAYYQNDESLISDAEYDEMLVRLKQLEENYIRLFGIEFDPTKSNVDIVDTPLVHDGVVRNVKMYSLDKCHSLKELHEYLLKSLEQGFSNDQTESEVHTSLKLDGVAIEIIYEKTELTQILTRGHNGWVGEDITDAVHMFSNLPRELYIAREEYIENFSVPGFVSVRGEAVISKANFDRINQMLADKNDRQYASPRHMVSGFLRNRSGEAYLSECIEFFAYGIGAVSSAFNGKYNRLTMDDYGDYTDVLEMLFALGFDLVTGTTYPVDIKDFVPFHLLYEFHNEYLEVRNRHPYAIDGIVYVLNSCIHREILGYTEHHPNWAIALKFPPVCNPTRILDIALQVGRTGKITPVAIIEPVKIDGVVVTKATLCNPNYIQRNDFRVGDRVILQRSGDVIPRIMKCDPDRGPDSKPFYIPTGCPTCSHVAYSYENIKDVYCSNVTCPDVIKLKLAYAVSKDCLDIMYLGDAIIAALLDANLVENLGDIFNLSVEDFVAIEVGEKIGTKIVEQIERAKRNMTLSKFIASLCIPNVGVVNARILAKTFGNLYNLINADKYQLNSIKGIGGSTATEIFDFFRSPHWLILPEDFKKLGMGCNSEDTGKLEGVTLAFTGSYQQLNRNKAIDILTRCGATVHSNVSRNTQFLVAGKNPKSKLGDAQDLYVPIWAEEDILSLLLMLESSTREVLLDFIRTTNDARN